MNDSSPVCALDACDAPIYYEGFCQTHFDNLLKLGLLKAPKPRKPLGRPKTDPVARFWSYVEKKGDDECWEWQGSRQPFGHGQFSLNGKPVLAHRFSVELATGEPIPPAMFVLHSCDNPPCVNPKHLRIGTPAENMRDRSERGRWNGGRKSKPSDSWETAPKLDRPLTDDEIRAIRTDPRSYRETAAAFGVSRSIVGHIRTGLRHADVA